MANRILIIGGVAGGASTAARLRRLDETVEIIMFERSDYISFANCGLPYIGGAIKNRDSLLLQKPESFKKRFNVEVRVKSEVVKINRLEKTVDVVEFPTGRKYTERYDRLILSPGAEPFRPVVEGIDSSRVFTLRNIADMDRIEEFIKTNSPQTAIIVGAGYIGLEMAENLHNRGLSVHVVEMLDQVMPGLDREMATFLHGHMLKQNVALHLGDGVSLLHQANSSLRVTLKSGKELECDLAILSAGVRPEVKLAKEAGLEIGSCGGIRVNEYLQTSDPNIYAIGDTIEVRDFVLGKAVLIPLAGPANKQGRMAADKICGRNHTYICTQGTSILKVFDLQGLDLAYAPPYGSGKDPVNIAGFAATNILDGTVKIKHFADLKKSDFILDVRTPAEFAGGRIPSFKNIHVNELRGKLDELPRDKTINVYCTVGFRSYVACRILAQNGFDARNMPGGYITYRTVANNGQLG
jgi:NADPH-dependent 2,4-dienoyl-CoA reductase/sulfur reductase-like enzyme